MNFDAEQNVILNETEKQTILEGLKLISLFCNNLTGCRECPFFDPDETPRGCELKSWMPCAWTIPDEWKTKGGDL